MNSCSSSLVRLVSIVTVIAASTAIPADARDTEEDWQYRRLFEPTLAEREQERRGQIMIYDGLTQGTVNAALDQGFERIENMMFIRIQITDENSGEVVDIEDDGC